TMLRFLQAGIIASRGLVRRAPEVPFDRTAQDPDTVEEISVFVGCKAYPDLYIPFQSRRNREENCKGQSQHEDRPDEPA
ncbi:hypothetical protein, partial [Stenotrophomonas sp. GbtcB23]|uniref:hypothetical protein n=1 Tax=Stenotrophomonas sp. GbtcB23 TaxID=2824768 RepID=UPI001C3005B2